MKRIIIRNSIAVCGFLLLTIIFSVAFIQTDDFLTSEIIGYSGIFLSLSLVYLAMRTYRNTIAGGTIRLGKSFKIGMLITLIGSVAFGIYSWIYYAFVDQGFEERYRVYLKEKIAKGGLPAEEASRYLKKLEEMPDYMRDPLFQSFLMFVTVLVIGAVISFISALIISRRKSPR